MRGAVSTRRTVRFAAVATAALVAGLLPGTDSVASGPDGTVHVGYACAFPSGASSTSGTSGTPSTSGPSGTSGTQEVDVALTQDFPSSGVVGKDIQPGPLTAAVTVPKEAVAALLPAGTAAVSGTAALTAAVTEGTSKAAAEWPGLTAPEAPAGDGDLVLTFGGTVPPLTVTAAGQVRFTAGRLSLTLHPRTGQATPPPGGTPPGTPGTAPTTTADTTGTPAAGGAPQVTIAPRTALADLTGTCVPKDGTPTLLGTVPVTSTSRGATTPSRAPGGPATGTAGNSDPRPVGGGATDPATSGHSGTIHVTPPPHSGLHDCPAPPSGSPDPAIIAQQHRPPGAVVTPGPGDPPFPPYSQCGFVTGYANVGKLRGAAVVNDLRQHPQLVNVVQKSIASDFSSDDPTQWYFELDSIAKLSLPPADSTFLTYGFVPTTAKMSMVPRGLMTVVTVGAGTLGTISTSTIYGQLDLRLYDVKVNGVPLDVGPDCHTVRPLDLKLVGYDRSSLTGVPTRPQDYSVQTGGPLAQDELFIPAFTGCASHGEDLDALFTSSVSGHGNSLNLIQGPLCVPVAQSGCDPEIAFPEPPHH
ncbi:DUF6801 domain-containing protein [Streptomyces sp. NPDC051976]|uniref:DUF6801 domain-containing protein n=1 Tax=Streptomyces sp. NPDC051976 TaxID=3154947 RepID=UPI0034143DFD